MNDRINISKTKIYVKDSTNINIASTIKNNENHIDILNDILNNSKALYKELCSQSEDISSLKINIEQLESYIVTGREKSKLENSLKSIRNIAEGAVGSTVSTLLISAVKQLI